MSFDLMVFEPSAAPTSSSEAFLEWYDGQTEWSEDHDCCDPAASSETLRLWLKDIVTEFPMMNGPLAEGFDEDDLNLADYSIGKTSIYVCFSWPSAEAAHKRVHSLAKKYRLGFFDITADTGGVWLPAKDDGYEMVFTADELEPAEDGYGLFVFDPDQAPKEQEPFVNWCIQLQEQLQEKLDRDVEDELDAKLQPWFMEITDAFPFMFDFSDLDMQQSVSNYCFCGPAVFAVFPKEHADKARTTVLQLAQKHNLGVHEISADGDVWLPKTDGGYEVAFRVTAREG